MSERTERSGCKSGGIVASGNEGRAVDGGGAPCNAARAVDSDAPTGAGRIARAFENKAFIPFVTCGDPDLGTTEELVVSMAEAGADLIELGIPFSDPTAEGPVIQQANIRALSAGTTTNAVFELVARIRERTGVPLAFMTYANVVFSYGKERFAARMADLGMDALILPDVPFEEKEEFAVPCREAGISLISMIAPTSRERIAEIATQAEGFLYCVSSLGVTGVRGTVGEGVAEMVALAKEANPDVPCAVGFGISTPEQAAAMSAISDGAIVGSAIVRMVGELGAECVEPVCEYVHKMKEAVSG